MMVIRGRRVTCFREAALLAFQEADMEEMAAEVAALFACAVDTERLRGEGKESVTRAIRREYGKDAWWEGPCCYIPVPSLRFDATGVPSLAAHCSVYLVATGRVAPSGGPRAYPFTLVGMLGKPFTLTLPLTWLQALLDRDTDRFPVVARDGHRTSWQVPGHKEALRLPNRICTHSLERRLCKGGSTTWCPRCRVRTFYYHTEGAEGCS